MMQAKHYLSINNKNRKNIVRTQPPSIFRFWLLAAAFLWSFTAGFTTQIAHAQTQSTSTTGSDKVAPQSCDPGYWQSMAARAWMEAEREIIQNQNLIFKPDSVMEYVCFDRFLEHYAKYGGDIFVHSQRFGDILKRCGPESMEAALTNVVLSSYFEYISGNFAHANLGERSSNMGVPAPGRGRALEIFPAYPSMRDYECSVMEEVWKAAKCINFIDNEDFQKTDGFYPFRTLYPAKGDNQTKSVAGYEDIEDPRYYPAALKCSGPGASVWKENIDQSRNEQTMYPFQTPLGELFVAVRKRLKPEECSAVILTGIKVITSNLDPYDDGLCTNPGCVPTKDGSSIKCVAK